MLHGGEIYDKKIEYDFSVNLNPYPCPEEVRKALLGAVDAIEKYPDITQYEFRNAVTRAENHYLESELGIDVKVTPEMIIGGNGASELILSIVRMLDPKKTLLPVPSFYGYRHALLSHKKDASIQEYFLTKDNDFEITLDFADEIKEDTDLVILANPNNPTGRCLEEAVFKRIIDRCKETGTALIVDECFLHLSDAGYSVLKYIHECKRLFVVSAYTKLFSLPGVRLGYAVSSKDNITNLKSFLPEWNLSVFAERAAVACSDIICNSDFVSNSKRMIAEERKKLENHLKEVGIRVFKSDVNYLIVFCQKELYELLLKKGILIRDCSNFIGLSKGFYRIAIKDAESNKVLLDAINTAL